MSIKTIVNTGEILQIADSLSDVYLTNIYSNARRANKIFLVDGKRFYRYSASGEKRSEVKVLKPVLYTRTDRYDGNLSMLDVDGTSYSVNASDATAPYSLTNTNRRFWSEKSVIEASLVGAQLQRGGLHTATHYVTALPTKTTSAYKNLFVVHNSTTPELPRKYNNRGTGYDEMQGLEPPALYHRNRFGSDRLFMTAPGGVAKYFKPYRPIFHHNQSGTQSRATAFNYINADSLLPNPNSALFSEECTMVNTTGETQSIVGPVRNTMGVAGDRVTIYPGVVADFWRDGSRWRFEDIKGRLTLREAADKTDGEKINDLTTLVEELKKQIDECCPKSSNRMVSSDRMISSDRMVA